MTELRLVTGEAEDGPFSAGTPLPRRLPPGRHGIPANLVVEHQRRRLLASMAEALAEHGYANVTTTQVSDGRQCLDQHLLQALRQPLGLRPRRLRGGGGQPLRGDRGRLRRRRPAQRAARSGHRRGTAFCAAEPAAAQLLCAQAPFEATALSAARRLLISRLAAMLRRVRGAEEGALQPPGLDERLIDATLAFLCARISRGETEALPALGPELAAILERPRRAA